MTDSSPACSCDAQVQRLHRHDRRQRQDGRRGARRYSPPCRAHLVRPCARADALYLPRAVQGVVPAEPGRRHGPRLDDARAPPLSLFSLSLSLVPSASPLALAKVRSAATLVSASPPRSPCAYTPRLNPALPLQLWPRSLRLALAQRRERRLRAYSTARTCRCRERVELALSCSRVWLDSLESRRAHLRRPRGGRQKNGTTRCNTALRQGRATKESLARRARSSRLVQRRPSAAEPAARPARAAPPTWRLLLLRSRSALLHCLVALLQPSSSRRS